MRNTGILLLIVGIFVFLNMANITNVLVGVSQLGFLNPKTAASSGTIGSGTSSTTGGPGSESTSNAK